MQLARKMCIMVDSSHASTARVLRRRCCEVNQLLAIALYKYDYDYDCCCYYYACVAAQSYTYTESTHYFGDASAAFNGPQLGPHS